MKKITLLFVALMASGSVSATQFSQSGLLPVGTCNLLNEDVSINLTTGVVAGVSCTATRIAIAACHTAGMVKSRNVGTKVVQVDDGAGNMVDQTVSCAIGTADPDCAGTVVVGPGVANATTGRGTVTTTYPGGGATGCANAAVPETVANGL